MSPSSCHADTCAHHDHAPGPEQGSPHCMVTWLITIFWNACALHLRTLHLAPTAHANAMCAHILSTGAASSSALCMGRPGACWATFRSWAQSHASSSQVQAVVRAMAVTPGLATSWLSRSIFCQQGHLMSCSSQVGTCRLIAFLLVGCSPAMRPFLLACVSAVWNSITAGMPYTSPVAVSSG